MHYVSNNCIIAWCLSAILLALHEFLQRTWKHNKSHPCAWYWKWSALGLVRSGNKTNPRWAWSNYVTVHFFSYNFSVSHSAWTPTAFVQAQKYSSCASYLYFMSLLFVSLNLSCNWYCYIQALQLLERTLSQAPEVLLDQPAIPLWDASWMWSVFSTVTMRNRILTCSGLRSFKMFCYP